MARALDRLRRQQGDMSALPANMKACGICGVIRALFSTHPPLEQRIQRRMDGSRAGQARYATRQAGLMTVHRQS